ncbi:MAG: hypothetical protein ABW193_06660 [Luteibacter sp.]
MKPADIFTLVERDVLDAVLSAMNPPLRDHFRVQLDVINHVQRLTRGKEVNLYCLHRGRPDFPERLLFPVRDELEVAKVDFAVDDSDSRNSVSVRMVGGRLFSLIFAKPPARTVSHARVHVEKVRLRADLALEHETNVELWGRQLAEGIVDARLPEDYLPLLATSMRHEGFVIHDPIHVRFVALDAFNCYIIAECDDRIGLGVIHGSDDGKLYRIDYETGVIVDVGQSLAVALSSYSALD